MSVTFSMFSIMSSLLMKKYCRYCSSRRISEISRENCRYCCSGVVSLLIYRVATIRYNVEAKRVYGVLSEAVLEAEIRLPCSYYEKLIIAGKLYQKYHMI